MHLLYIIVFLLRRMAWAAYLAIAFPVYLIVFILNPVAFGDALQKIGSEFSKEDEY